MSRRWTDAEVQALLNGIGSYGFAWLRRKTGVSNVWPNSPKHRSNDALYAAVRRNFGGGGLTRGAYSLRQISTETGYSRTQLERARDALAQKWKRMGVGGSYIITEEQVEEVIVWLSHDYWDKDLKLYCCLRCQTEGREPHGLGLCSRCYAKYRRQCCRLGVPTTPEGQRAVLSRIPVDRSGVLDDIRATLDAGKAITHTHITWIHTQLG